MANNEYKSDVLVSIRCMVYNHEPYLRKCFDGFVMQKTSFNFEVIVHDDASTDGSKLIICEYVKKYPNIFKPIFESENQYSKGITIIHKKMDEIMSRSSKYVALCEGDDYWINPYKLQKQVDILEKHLECSFCGTGFRILKEDGSSVDMTILDNGTDVSFYGIDTWTRKWIHKTLTLLVRKEIYVMYRKIALKYEHPKDTCLTYHLLKEGMCAYIPQCMGVYSDMGQGVWNSKTEGQKILVNLNTMRELYFKNNRDNVVYDHYMYFLNAYIRSSNKDNKYSLWKEGYRESIDWKSKERLIKSLLAYIKCRIK